MQGKVAVGTHAQRPELPALTGLPGPLCTWTHGLAGTRQRAAPGRESEQQGQEPQLSPRHSVFAPIVFIGHTWSSVFPGMSSGATSPGFNPQGGSTPPARPRAAA